VDVTLAHGAPPLRTPEPSERHAVDVPGGRLSLVLHLPDAGAPAPCVVACHGLSASKDSDKYLLLGAALPAAGFALARFDFRGCGESTGREDETTVATRIEDVDAVVEHLGRHPRLSGEFGFLGSSLGGFVALHVAALRAGDPVVTWNAPADLLDLANAEGDDRPGIGVPFLMELATHRHEATPGGVPRHLVIQGEADDVVPVEHGVVLHARAAEPCDLVVIPGADHRLTDAAHRRAAVEASLAWFRRFLPERPA
jgi:pimeloyl-ACP methyl ester carboxylesterase